MSSSVILLQLPPLSPLSNSKQPHRTKINHCYMYMKGHGGGFQTEGEQTANIFRNKITKSVFLLRERKFSVTDLGLNPFTVGEVRQMNIPMISYFLT